MADLPSFRDAFRKRRCLVLADGFYEWKQEGDRKLPVYIHMKDGETFAFAGLWEHWEDQEGQVIESCTMLTTEPNELLAQVHKRMPVILDPNEYDLWLNPDEQEVSLIKSLLRSYPAEEMNFYPVNLRVNNPRNDDALCLEQLPAGKATY